MTLTRLDLRRPGDPGRAAVEEIYQLATDRDGHHPVDCASCTQRHERHALACFEVTFDEPGWFVAAICACCETLDIDQVERQIVRRRQPPVRKMVGWNEGQRVVFWVAHPDYAIDRAVTKRQHYLRLVPPPQTDTGQLLDLLAWNIGTEPLKRLSHIRQHLVHLDVETRAKVAEAVELLLYVTGDPWTEAADPAWLEEHGFSPPDTSGRCQACQESHGRIQHGLCATCNDPIEDYQREAPAFYCTEICRMAADTIEQLRERAT